MDVKFFSMFVLMLGSYLPVVLLEELAGGWTIQAQVVQILVLAAALVFSVSKRRQGYPIALPLLLLVLAVGTLGTDLLRTASFWTARFPVYDIRLNVVGSIILKSIPVCLTLAVLFTAYRRPERFYLVKGDLSVKAEPIAWLGIPAQKISWGNLAALSAVLISLGTALLMILPMTGAGLPPGFANIPRQLALILLLALTNSFFEGVVFRNGILRVFDSFLPKSILLVAGGLYFGIGHFYGAPSGIGGVAMASLLGWYMNRAMYETKGVLCSWMIHALQDAVIFSFLFAVAL